MKLKQIFKEDIFRNIEGVIKADDDTNLLEEVKEYVITNEIRKKLEIFLEEYLNYQGANGVWISGFFGSGKSHLLKILSYVLSNYQINDHTLGDIFLTKVEDEITKANLNKAINIPSKSILFNIDQKADITNKQQPDAILSVFVKVFNEMQGYYPKHGYVAKFERDLDKQGLYEQFKQTYEKIAGESWNVGREEILLEIENFGKALSEVKGMPYEDAIKVIDKYESTYKTSIEEFAEDVKEYIDNQEKGFRLNFFVDEIGQYISDNTKLMLNLQTIAETLATKCKGQSWIIVTSQQDINAVIGDMTDRQANDFSRIQARFKANLSLTSANVDEVIQKRLLDKDPGCEDSLNNLYEKEKNNIKTLTQFTDGSRVYKGFESFDQFKFSYPLLPYQFDLFQASIRGLSKHNAFQGKHQSVGERSMLSVFQSVVQKIADKNIGEISTYDLMFEGLRATVRGEIQSEILVAERNLPNEFAIKVLKVLFMVKYVKEFKATPKNIGVLLINDFDLNLTDHEKNVKESLNILEEQSYVQRNGDIYEFLTDEEKDVEEEIKGTKIEANDVGDLLADLIFTETIRDTKIRFEENKNDYSFCKKMDDTLLGTEKPVAINFITPLNEIEKEDSVLKANSMGKSELIIKLPEDSQLYKDLHLFKKTEKYILQTHSNSLSDSVTQILASKSQLNTERRRNMKAKVEQLLSKAKMFMNGTEIEINSSNPKTKITLAFQQLIKIAYPHVTMLRTIYKEEDLKTHLLQKNDDLFKNDDASISEAENEMLQYITRNKQSGERTTSKAIIDKFSGIPYGWPLPGILCILAKIYLRGKVEIKRDSNILDDKGVYESLSNNRHYANTIIEPQQDFNKQKIRKLKDLHQAYFDEANSGKEAKDVAISFKEKLISEITTLEKLQIQKNQYPFLEVLDDHIKNLNMYAKQEYPYFLNEIDNLEAELLDTKDNLIDPVKRFMNSTQKDIYDDVLSFSGSNKDNFEYLSSNETKSIFEVKESREPYKGDLIQKAKQSLDIVKAQIETKVNEEKDLAISKIEETESKVVTFSGFSDLTEEQKQSVLAPFVSGKEQIKDQSLIDVIKVKADTITNKYQNQVTLISVLLNENKGGTEFEVKNIYLNVADIKLNFEKKELETEQDVEDYVAKLKEEYLKTIKENKRILL